MCVVDFVLVRWWLFAGMTIKEETMINSILFFLYALAYSIYVLFLSVGCIFMFMALTAGIITIACYIWPEKKEFMEGEKEDVGV